MNPAPGWPDLHYVDTEQVELDVPAIIARGTRLRRRRLVTKLAAVALVIGVAPVVVIADMMGTTVITAAPYGDLRRPPVGPASGAHVKAAPIFGAIGHVKAPAALGTADSGSASKVTNARESTVPEDTGTAGENFMFSLAQAVVRPTTTLSRGYGPLLAIAGARAGSAVWFTAAAAQLTLFRLSTAGALKSWPLPTPASSVRASAGVGLAVTTAGVAWIGVGSTLLRLDTKNSKVSAWQVPAPAHRASDAADSVAVSLDGYVAVAMSDSSSVQVLDPREGTFRRIKLPGTADQPLAIGYARNGTLGVGYEHQGRPSAGAVLLVTRTGAQRSTGVPQPTALAPYGASGLLAGVTELTVVPERGHPRSLALPADQSDFAGVTTRPAPLPGNRLAIAMDTAILTFPATTSSAIATTQAQLSVVPSPGCQPHHGCPAGYQLLATDSDGDLWVVPKADRRTVELVSLR
jgi:hypothetical protein